MSESGLASPEAAQEDLAPGFERAFSFLPEERSYGVREIEGSIPAFLRGSCYWNGPARFARGGLRYRHWLDGDGMVCALRFGDEGIEFTNRFVRSAKWTAEEEAGRPLFRAFGTAFPGDRLVRGIALESPVNVSVHPYAGTLLACGEQGLPWELDPRTLATRGTFTFGGALNALSPFSAHAKIDPRSGELLNFGISYASAQPCLNVYRFAASGALLARRRVALPYPASLHDFCASTGHLVFFLSPYVLDLGALAGEGRTLMESLSWQPELGSRLLVVSRASGELVASVAAGSAYSLHTINASEDGEKLTVDLLELDRPVYDQYQEMPDLFTAVGEGRPVRLVVDLRRGRLAARQEIDYQLAPDFPAIDLHRAELPCRDFWMLGISATGRAGRKFFDQLVHVDWAAPGALDMWQAPPGHYLAGEPLMVADPAAPADGRAGALICPLFDSGARSSRILLFDPLDVAAGPRATLHLEAPVPPSFHSTFVAQCSKR